MTDETIMTESAHLNSNTQLTMKKTLLSLGVCLAALGLQAQSTYLGNGNTAWGGAVGGGSLTVSDSGADISFTLNRGPGNLDNVFVLYLDTVAGGFADTTGFSDAADGGRSAVSGWSGTQRSTLNFASGFAPDFAVSIENGYASLFQLASGGNGSLGWQTGAPQSGANNSATYGLTFGYASLGLSAGESLNLFGLMVSGTGYSSPEAIGGSLTGINGWDNSQDQTAYSVYTITVPEPSVLALCGLSGLAALFVNRRRR
jgi:hypothetical protein